MTSRAQIVVVALGGNAAYPPHIRGTAEEQLDVMAALCEHLVGIVRDGHKLVLTHGNGPVVGNILFRMARTAKELPPMPMDVCVSHSQGGMGYMFQQSFANVLARQQIGRAVAAIVTQVAVDPADPAFSAPTKPVGRFFSRDEATQMAAETAGPSSRMPGAATAESSPRRSRSRSSRSMRSARSCAPA